MTFLKISIKKIEFFVLQNLPMGSRKFTFSQKLSLHYPVKKNKNKSLSLSAGVGPICIVWIVSEKETAETT